MARSRATLPILLSLGTLAALVAGGAIRAQTPGASDGVPERYRDRLRVADSLVRIWRVDTALTVLQPALRDARRRGDRRSLGYLLHTQATLQVQAGSDPGRAAREAMQIAAAAGDTATLMGALQLLGPVMVAHDGLEEPATEWLLRVALNRDDYKYESLARSALAAQALEAGHFEEARRGYQRAIGLSQQARDWRSELVALTGLGNAGFGLGDFDRARASHAKVARLASERKDDLREGQAYRALGELEWTLGDPEAAAGHFRRAWTVLLRTGSVARWFEPAAATAVAERHMARYADAETTLRQVISAADSAGAASYASEAWIELTRTRERAAEPDAQAQAAREGLARGRSLAPAQRAELALSLARALGSQDSAAAGLQVLDRESRGYRGRIPAALVVDIEIERSELQTQQARPREALEALQRGLRQSARVGWQRVDLLARLARVEVALGRPERAIARVAEGLDAWESDPDPSVDPNDRERRTTSGRRLFSTIAEVTLANPTDSTAEAQGRLAYDALQRFKDRALRDATLGPRLSDDNAPERLASPPLSAAALQDSVLTPDEVLLDAFVAPVGSFLFAVTKDEIRWTALPDGPELERRVREYQTLLAGPAAPGGALAATDSASARVGQWLLSGLEETIRKHRRIVFAPDGALSGLPLGAVSLASSGSVALPLALDHEIEFTPAATLFAKLRRARRSDPPLPRVLALAASGAGSDGPLPGALREVRILDATFKNVEVRITDRSRDPIARPKLANCELIHFAGPIRIDDRHPWHSGVLIERPGDPERDPYLRTSAIARSRLQARLVVLSGNLPAIASPASDEGARGVAAAFASAGVPAVVMGLWRVEERTTARLMDAFYEALAQGAPVGVALRSAQEALRNDPTTRHPHHWAGFVLIGDGIGRVPLSRKPVWLWPALGAAIVVLGVGLLMMRRRTRHAA